MRFPVLRLGPLVIIGILLMGLGTGLWKYLDYRVTERISDGERVTGVVTGKSSPWWQRTPRTMVDVRYEYSNREYVDELGTFGGVSNIRVGMDLELYVDESDPTRVATAGRLASEGGWFEIPMLLWLGGGFFLGVAPVISWVSWRRLPRELREAHSVPPVSLDACGAEDSLEEWMPEYESTRNGIVAKAQSELSTSQTRLHVCLRAVNGPSERNRVRIQRYVRKWGLVSVEAHIPTELSVDPDAVVRDRLVRAIDLAAEKTRKKHPTQDFRRMRHVVESAERVG